MSKDGTIKQSLIQRILNRHYSARLDWAKPKVMDGVGPFYPKIFDYFDAHRQAAIDASKETLQELSEEWRAEKFHADGQPKPASKHG